MPYVVAQWRREHPGEDIPDGQVFTQPWPAGPAAAAATRSSTTSTRPTGPAGRCAASTSRSKGRASRRRQGTGQAQPVRPASGGTRTVNRDLEEKARALAGLKGYVTNLRACPDGTPVTAEFVIGAYHQLFQIEKSFRMAKSDLQARPVYHRTRDSIEAHLTIVFAALAVSRWIEPTTGWSIRKFVKTARRYRTIQIQAGDHVITAADPLPEDLHAPSARSAAPDEVRTSLAEVRSCGHGLSSASGDEARSGDG